MAKKKVKDPKPSFNENMMSNLGSSMDLLRHLESIYGENYAKILAVLSVTFSAIGINSLGPEKFQILLDALKAHVKSFEEEEEPQPKPKAKAKPKKPPAEQKSKPVVINVINPRKSRKE